MAEEDFAELVRRAAEGSEEAAREILELYGHHIRRVVRRKLECGQKKLFDSHDYVSDVWPTVFTPDGLRHYKADRPETFIDGLTDTICTHIVQSFQQAGQAPGHNPGPCQPNPGGHPEILVVEDDDAIRQMLDLALRGHGFTVRLASGGQEAVDVYRAHQGTIDVVLMDVQMPHVDGPQTLALLRQINPGVRCCLMSGHAGSYTAEQLLQLGAAGVLQKPFRSLAELADVLRQLAQK